MTLFRVFLIVTASLNSSSADVFKGINFPQGSASFVDQVVAYDPFFSGGAGPTAASSKNPLSSIGIPDHPGGIAPGSVALGSGGRLTLRFTNNALTGSNDSSKDLYIFEVGAQVEAMTVEISKDGFLWHGVGGVFGSTSSIDIDSFGFSSLDRFYFVRLTDDPNGGDITGPYVGADIDAVGAITSIRSPDIPKISISPSTLSGLAAIEISLQTALGSLYTIEETMDFSNPILWAEAIGNIQGDGTIKRFKFTLVTERKFFRVRSN